MNRKTIIITAAVTVVVIAGGIWIFGTSKAQNKVEFVTEPAKTATVSNSITATGTIEPVTEVQVGTQVKRRSDCRNGQGNAAQRPAISASYIRRCKSRIRLPEETLRAQPETS